MAITLMLVCFAGSFFVLAEREAVRALWLLGIGFFLAVVAGVSIAMGLTSRDRPLDLGRHVSPYGATKYSPGPSTPYVPLPYVSGAQGGGEE